MTNNDLLINYLLKNYIGRLSMGIFVAVNVFGFPLYYQNWKEVRQNIIEAKSQELATLPILYAERDRT